MCVVHSSKTRIRTGCWLECCSDIQASTICSGVSIRVEINYSDGFLVGQGPGGVWWLKLVIASQSPTDLHIFRVRLGLVSESL